MIYHPKILRSGIEKGKYEKESNVGWNYCYSTCNVQIVIILQKMNENEYISKVSGKPKY